MTIEMNPMLSEDCEPAWTCADCGTDVNRAHSGPDYEHAGPRCWPCTRKHARAARNTDQRNGRVQPFYVACYGVDRCYGGPEEGGWYYDATAILAVRKVWNYQQGLRAARELRAEYPTCSRGRHSVLGGTDTIVQTFRTLDDLPQETTERPRYE